MTDSINLLKNKSRQISNTTSYVGGNTSFSNEKILKNFAKATNSSDVVKTNASSPILKVIDKKQDEKRISTPTSTNSFQQTTPQQSQQQQRALLKSSEITQQSIKVQVPPSITSVNSSNLTELSSPVSPFVTPGVATPTRPVFATAGTLSPSISTAINLDNQVPAIQSFDREQIGVELIKKTTEKTTTTDKTNTISFSANGAVSSSPLITSVPNADINLIQTIFSDQTSNPGSPIVGATAISLPSDPPVASTSTTTLFLSSSNEGEPFFSSSSAIKSAQRAELLESSTGFALPTDSKPRIIANFVENVINGYAKKNLLIIKKVTSESFKANYYKIYKKNMYTDADFSEIVRLNSNNLTFNEKYNDIVTSLGYKPSDVFIFEDSFVKSNEIYVYKVFVNFSPSSFSSAATP